VIVPASSSDGNCEGFKNNKGVSDVSDADEQFGAVEGMVHIFRGGMHFPLTAGVAPLGVSARVYTRPSDAEPSSPGGQGDFVLELRNSGIGIFEKRFRVDRPVSRLYSGSREIRDGDSSSVADFKRFTVSVVEPPAYDSFAVSWAGRELFTAKKSPSVPSVDVLGVSEGQVFSARDVIDLCLRGVDVDGDRLSYRVYSSVDGGDTYRLYTGGRYSSDFDWREIDSSEVMVSISNFAGGPLPDGFVGRVGVAVSDGARAAFAESPPFRVVEQESGPASERLIPYRVSIKSPAALDRNVFSGEEKILLEAESDTWLGDGVEYRWRSNLDGELGTGKSVELPAYELTIGNHRISVTATNKSTGRSSWNSRGVAITPPGVQLLAIDDVVRIQPHERVHIYVQSNDIKRYGYESYFNLEATAPPKLGEAKVTYAHSDVIYYVISYISRVSGRDSFVYEVCDWDSFCDTATVHVSVGLDDCTISGTDGNDQLVGTPADDIICALDGNDIIEGLGGDDIIRAGKGNDTIFGRAGDDYIQGETGDDTIHGEDGEDLILGGNGNDTLYGGAGYDTLGGGNTITEQNPGDKLYYTDTAAPAAYPELTAKEVELLDEATTTCLKATTRNSRCAQTTNELCQTISAGSSQWPSHQKQRTAITSFLCEAADLAQTIDTAFQNRPTYDPYPDSQTIELRDLLKREAQTLFTPLAENNHQITETTTAKLRQLAEAIHDFAVPAYRDDPHPIG